MVGRYLGIHHAPPTQSAVGVGFVVLHALGGSPVGLTTGDVGEGGELDGAGVACGSEVRGMVVGVWDGVGAGDVVGGAVVSVTEEAK